ncbi:MAG: 4-(cytidine 5'-diphospho)-2-C-methyl-D-erythritol kinase [Clostridiales Family XIII bacterium]|jgi:4-diphosphocytidyl-2-C-methyl-D-erythritol kinase|nr:4-(cytidine 5'-diphospho)-2-C-methyl-D-erythritol kinase [Clostridiales Family XIII bacterium]
MSEIEIKAYAKINLSIDVLEKRPDGYHSVRTVLQQVNLYDTLTAATGGTGGGLALSVEGKLRPGGEVPVDGRNLAVRGARAFLAEYAPRFPGRFSIRIQKRIPVAAGLGGGSADAAAAILALSRLCGVNPGLKKLMELGSRLGADVPFCLMGQAARNPALGFAEDPMAKNAALGEGIGEKLTPLPSLPGWVLLVKPAVSVSTAAVYGALKLEEIRERPDTDALIQVLKDKNYTKIAKNMVNVLEIPALKEYSEIAQLKNLLTQDVHAEKVMMSGSGAAVFAYYREQAPCEAALSRLAGQDAAAFALELL